MKRRQALVERILLPFVFLTAMTAAYAENDPIKLEGDLASVPVATQFEVFWAFSDLDNQGYDEPLLDYYEEGHSANLGFAGFDSWQWIDDTTWSLGLIYNSPNQTGTAYVWAGANDAALYDNDPIGHSLTDTFDVI